MSQIDVKASALSGTVHGITVFVGELSPVKTSSKKFCTYTLMETTKNLILHSETIDKREIQNKSPNMEREAANRALTYLKGKVNVVEITTDCSTSVTKMLGLFLNSVYFLWFISEYS